MRRAISSEKRRKFDIVYQYAKENLDHIEHEKCQPHFLMWIHEMVFLELRGCVVPQRPPEENHWRRYHQLNRGMCPKPPAFWFDNKVCETLVSIYAPFSEKALRIYL